MEICKLHLLKNQILIFIVLNNVLIYPSEDNYIIMEFFIIIKIINKIINEIKIFIFKTKTYGRLILNKPN